jgi:alpha-tubulin suppressor-like RCC1 family protein
VPTAVTTTGVTTWKFVSTGYDSTCGIKTDDTLWCWGANNQAQLAIGYFSAQELVPMAASTANGSSWKSISLGDGAACGLRNDDSLWCWGYGAEGNHGNGILTNQSVPVPVPGNRLWKQVSADWTICGIQADDTLWCWAENYFGSVGNNTAIQQNFPVPIATGTCQNPTGVAGDIMFNENTRVLQWCDGFKWYAAGKAPTLVTDMGCTGPVGVAGDLIYNSTLNLPQYCDGDRWRSIHR